MTDQLIPKSRDELSAEWLTGVLREAGVLNGDGEVASLALQEIGAGRGYVGITIRLLPGYAGETEGAPRSIIAKLPINIDLSPEIQMLVNLLYSTEISWYRELRERTAVTTPRFIWGAGDPGTGRFCLLLEDLGGMRDANQVQSCGIDDARLIITNLAKMHAGWWNSAELTSRTWLYGPEMAGALTQIVYQPAWPQFATHFRERPWMAEFEAIGAAIGAQAGALSVAAAAHGFTLAHGDYRLENFLFGEPGQPDEFVLIDWQLCGRGSGLRDLAYFIGQNMETEFRREHEATLIRIYHETLLAHGVAGFSFEQCMEGYRIGLLLAMFVPVNGVRTYNDARVTSTAGFAPDQIAMLEKALASGLLLLDCMADRNVAAILDNNAGAMLAG